MAKKLFSITLFFSLALWGYSQSTTVLHEAIDKTITLSNESANINTQNVLDILSRTEGPKSLQYNFKEHREITKQGTKLMINVAVGNVSRQGDYAYQQFNINDFLVPKVISYTYQLNDAENKVIDSKTVNERVFKAGEYLIKENIASFDGEDKCSIGLTNIIFDFKTKDSKALDEFVTTVDSYYDVDAQLKLINQELDKLYLDSIELIEDNYKITEKNIASIASIKSFRFVSKLQLNAFDPLFYRTNISKTEVKNRTIKKELEHKIKYMHETYYKKGLQWLAWNDSLKATIKFNLSIKEKVNYAPPYYQLAAIDYQHKEYTKAIDSCQMIISKLNPDNDIRYATLKLAEQIVYHFIDSINMDIDDREFANAVTKLNTTIAYTENIKGIKIFSEFDAIYTRLYQAYYDEFVEETELLLQEALLEEAHFNIDSLARFRSAHQQYINNPEKEYTLQNKLFIAWVDRGKNEEANHRPNNALTAFDQAKKICTSYDKVECTEELAVLLHAQQQIYYVNMLVHTRMVIHAEYADSALHLLSDAKQTLIDWKLDPDPIADTLFIDANQLKYRQLIEAGDEAMHNYAPREAIAFYKEAIQLSDNIAITPNLAIGDKIKKAAVALCITYCNHGETQIDALQIDKAFHYLNKAKSIAAQYDVSNDEDVLKHIKSLEDALNQGECSKAMYQFNIQLNAAQKLIDTKDFVNAEKALEKTKEIAKSHNECNLPDSIAAQLSENIRPIKNYQISMQDIDQLIDQKSFANALEEYDYITTYYNDSIPDKYNVILVPMYDFIANNKNSGLKDYAIRYYIEGNDTEQSLKLLYILYQEEYIAEWAKKSQIALGVQLAMNDFKTNPNLSAEQKVLKYTKDDKWFNDLKKAYLSQWKKL